MQSGKYAQLEAGREDVSYLLLFRSKCTQLNYSQKLFHGERAEMRYHAVSSTPPQLNRMPLICSPAPVVDLIQTPM